MTSKTEIKELIEALRDEVRELKNEIEVLKTLVVNEKPNIIYPYVITAEPKPELPPYESTAPYTPPRWPTVTCQTKNVEVTTHQYNKLPDSKISTLTL